MVWERFARSAPGEVGKQHRAHPGVALECFPPGHSEPSLASTSLTLSGIICSNLKLEAVLPAIKRWFGFLIVIAALHMTEQLIFGLDELYNFCQVA